MNEQGYKDINEYRMVAQEDTWPDTMPTESRGCCGRAVPLDDQEIDGMLEHCEKKIEDLEAKFGKEGADAEERERSFTGKCFVVLAKQADMHKVCNL